MENKDKLSKLLTELQNREKAKRFQEIVSGVSAQVYKVIEPLTSKKLKEHANAVAKVVGELENNVFKATKLLDEGKKENAEVLATLQVKLAENQTELKKQVKVFEESFDKVQKRFEERGKKIEGSVTELAEKAQKANEAILKIIADIKSSIPKQVELEEGDNIKIDKSEKDGKVVYKITGERPVISISGGTGGGTSLPDQTGNSGKFLTTDGSNPSWGNPAGSGTVTSVSVVGTSTIGATVTNATSTPQVTMNVLPLGIGLSELGEKSYNSLTDLPNLGNYVLGTSLYNLYVLGTSVSDYVIGASVFGQYILGGSFHSAVSVVGSSTVQLGISNNQSLIATVLQAGLGLSNFGEKSYNSLSDTPDLSIYAQGNSVYGHYVLKTGDTVTGVLDVQGIRMSGVSAIGVTGRMLRWNDTDVTLDIGLTNGVVLQVGQEMHIRAVNKTGVTLPNGSVVYITGSQGNRPTIALALGSTHTMSHVAGILTESIPNNQEGFITTSGYVRTLDTSAFTEGDTLWLSGVSAGKMVNVEPSIPHHSPKVGVVTNAHATQGSVLVNIIQHQALEELSDVDGVVPENRALLVYGASNYWNADNDLLDIFDNQNSAGRLWGGTITNLGGGNVFVAAGQGVVKNKGSQPAAGLEDVPTALSDGQGGIRELVTWTGTTVTLAGTGYNLVYYDSSASGFTTQLRENFYANFDFVSDFTVGRVFYDGSNTTIRLCGMNIWNFPRRVQMFGEERFPVERATGLVLGNPSGRYISVTAGVLWAELVNRFSVSATDTSVGGTFTYWHRNGVGGWTSTLSQTEINNTNYDDGDGTLGTLTAQRYGVHWVYVVHDSSVHVVYGQGDYTLAQAEITTPPAILPPIIEAYATLIGRIIIQKSATSLTEVVSAFDKVFATTATQQHNDLSGLQGGTTNEYYHLSQAGYSSIHNAVVGVNSATVAIGVSSNQAIGLSVIQSGLGLSNFGEKSYNSLADKPTIDTLLPSQTGNSGKFLSTNGTNASWQSPAGAGTVTNFSAVGTSTIGVTVTNPTSTPELTARVLPLGIGLSELGEKSYNSLADKPDLSVYILGASVIGQYVLGTSIYTNEMAQDAIGLSLVQQSDSITWFYDDPNNNLYADVSVDNTTIEVDTTNNYIKVKQSGLGLSAFGERAYASLTGTPTAPSGVGGTFISVGVSSNNAIGASLIRVQDDYRSRSFFIEAPTATDDFPIQYVMTGITITNVVYAISGGTNWVGQLQVAYNAQGQSALDTQAADSTVASNVNGVSTSSFSVAGVTANAYLRLKTTSVAGGVSWLHVTYFYTAR